MANKWANGVSDWEEEAEGGGVAAAASHRLAPANVRVHPKAYRSQPRLHLCLADLANDVFIYSDCRT